MNIITLLQNCIFGISDLSLTWVWKSSAFFSSTSLFFFMYSVFSKKDQYHISWYGCWEYIRSKATSKSNKPRKLRTLFERTWAYVWTWIEMVLWVPLAVLLPGQKVYLGFVPTSARTTLLLRPTYPFTGNEDCRDKIGLTKYAYM